MVTATIQFIQAGLQNAERCVWITRDRTGTASPALLLKALVPFGEHFLLTGQLKAFSYEEWFLQHGVFSTNKALSSLDCSLEQALAREVLRDSG
jgi:hypothetical protein